MRKNEVTVFNKLMNWSKRTLTLVPINTFGVVLDTWLLLLSKCRCFSFDVTLFELERRIGCEHDLPSAHVESGHPHSNCLTKAACRAARCFSINWATIASTVSAVCRSKEKPQDNWLIIWWNTYVIHKEFYFSFCRLNCLQWFQFHL